MTGRTGRDIVIAVTLAAFAFAYVVSFVPWLLSFV